MAAAGPQAGSTLQRVLHIKERLNSTNQDSRKIAKSLKELQETKISLEILVETGIGKAVNSFRKHSDVGDVAKSLVSKWKKLVPIENQSDPKGQPYDVNDSLQSPIPKPSKLSNGKIKVSESAEKGNRKSSHSNESKPQNAVKIKDTAKETDEKSLHHGKPPKNSDPKKNEVVASDMPLKICNGRQSKSESVSSKPVTAKKDQVGHNKGILQTTNEFPKLKISNSLVESAHQKDNPKMDVKLDGEDFDPPTMSFESYLNYDQASGKRKKKNSLTESSKKIKTELLKVPENKTFEKEKIKSKPDLVPESQVKKVNVENLEDLLDVPLPKFLPYYASFPSLTYESDKGTAPETVSQEHSDMNCFTGKRLNSKMQVYSGSKPIFLSKMLSLYEQCLRVLQNNIDLLHEVGGVPFEILEPVLERCTPEQLYRIEECNPTFVEESDHLWKKHCQKDFRNEHLLEYESWREMYLRLFSEREEKLQKITKDISSAHSGKPKGRQVKLAYVHSSAKPPRSIRRKQEIFGTAGPIAQPHPIDRMKMQKLERERKKLSSSSNASTSTASVAPGSPTNGPSQQNRRPPAPPLKRVAPMMAKSLRAFKNRVGPR